MREVIEKTVNVPCSPAEAFSLFVERLSSWWPLERHAVSAAAGKPARDVTVEPILSGAVFETMYDGQRADWGTVLAYEPGVRFAMSWHPGQDVGMATRVEVRFDARSDGGTSVTLIHSGWEIWAEEAPARRDNYDSGWDLVLGECFAGAAGG